MPLQVNILSSTLLRHVLNYALKASVATALLTFTALPSANNTLVLNDGAGPYTLTWKASLTGAANEVVIGADTNASAINLANAINKGTGAATTYSGNITVPRTITAQATAGTSYDSANADTLVPLQASATAGGTTAMGAVAALSTAVGNYFGFTDWWAAQSFIPSAGLFTSFTVTHSSSYNTPVGTVTWELRSNNGGKPGAILTSGTYTPVASSANIVNVPLSAQRMLDGSTTYWLTFHATTVQTTDKCWTISLSSNTNPYANGITQWSSDGGSTWAGDTPGEDMLLTVTTTATATKTKLAQSFVLPYTQSPASLTLNLAKFGSPTGTLTLRIESDSAGAPSGTLVDTNAVATLDASTLTTTLTDTTFTFTAPPALTAGPTLWIVLSTSDSASAVNFVVWGADASSPSYASGAMYSYAGSWSAESKDACFSLGAASVTLSAALHGAVGNAYSLSITGTWATLSGANFAGGVDEPADLAPSLDTGVNTFQYAADGWTADGANPTNAMTAINQIVQSEYGSLFWIARDGTITFKNRRWLFGLANQAADLTISSEHNALDGATGFDTLVNYVSANYTPPGTLASGVVAKDKSAYEVAPGLTGLTERWNPTQQIGIQPGTKVVKLPYSDPTTGQKIAALSVVTPLAPTTDFTAYDNTDPLTAFNYTNSTVLKFSVVVLGTGVEITITNSAIGPLYIFGLQCRGVGLTYYTPSAAVAEDADSQALYGRRVMSFELPFVSTEAAFADRLVAYLLARYAAPAYRLNSITFQGQNLLGNTNLYSIEIGDVLAITDYQTGVTAQKYVIVGLSYEGIGPGRTGAITWHLKALDDTTYAIWGTSKWAGADKWSL